MLTKQNTVKNSALTFDNLGGAFLLLAAGCLISILFISMEILCFKKPKKVKGNLMEPVRLVLTLINLSCYIVSKLE